MPIHFMDHVLLDQQLLDLVARGRLEVQDRDPRLLDAIAPREFEPPRESRALNLRYR